jgi:hypothetical protein
MKTFEEIADAADEDFHYGADLLAELHRTPRLHSKWAKFHYEYRLALASGNRHLDEMIKERLCYYSGKADAKVYRDEPFNETVSSQKEMDRYLMADRKINVLREMISRYEFTLERITGIVDWLKYRDNSIKTMIELRRFESGE